MEQYENETNYAIAIDNDFLMLKPEPILTSTIKLFARISPENKALIVRKFKKQEDYAFQQLSFS
jgi:magnesium-transporting ATPase (P-type)